MLGKLKQKTLRKRLEKLRIADDILFEDVVSEIDKYGFNVNESKIRKILSINRLTTNLVTNKVVISTIAFRLYLKHLTTDRKDPVAGYDAFLERTDINAYNITLKARAMIRS
jgi:hypothetical protein